MVSGNSELSEATVLNTLQFSTGDLYSRDEVQQGQGRLFGLDIIRSASVTSDFQSDPDSVIPITVNVVEGDAYRVRYGGGWTTAECFGVEAQWAARNFVGGGRLLQVRGRVANVLTPQFQNVLCPQGGTEEFGELTGTLSLDFAQPWIFSTRNSFSTALFIERQSLPDVFIREAVGVELALTRLIGPQTSFTLSYSQNYLGSMLQKCCSAQICWYVAQRMSRSCRMPTGLLRSGLASLAILQITFSTPIADTA
ncbi:MAG: hypothetical protein Ct9H300mP15_18510 [Gemmatimonadota bacterium]|nr:MAG: hypothetical protein Ct9H300mP15_18510 [Gemmatimonadota bacterium]